MQSSKLSVGKYLFHTFLDNQYPAHAIAPFTVIAHPSRLNIFAKDWFGSFERGIVVS